jgi:hypothetical protein
MSLCFVALFFLPPLVLLSLFLSEHCGLPDDLLSVPACGGGAQLTNVFALIDKMSEHMLKVGRRVCTGLLLSLPIPPHPQPVSMAQFLTGHTPNRQRSLGSLQSTRTFLRAPAPSDSHAFSTLLPSPFLPDPPSQQHTLRHGARDPLRQQAAAAA